VRALAAATGLIGYLLFAALVTELFSADSSRLVALAPCTGEAPGAAAAAPPFYLRLEEPRSISLCGSFLGEPPLLVLPRVSGNWLTVTVDGREHLRVGAPDRPANLWITPHLVRLGKLEPGLEHRVKLDLGGLYDLGVRIPPYLADWSSGGLRATVLR